MQTHIVPVGFDYDRIVDALYLPFSGFKRQNPCPKTNLNPSSQKRQSASI